MKLAFFIGTTNAYFDSNVNRVSLEAINNGISAEDIYIVSSQEESNQSTSINNCKVYKITYTGMHLSPFIYISENLNMFSKYTHFCVLPCTVRLGKQFYSKLKTQLDKLQVRIDCIPFNTSARGIRSMEMGIMSHYWLHHISNYLSMMKRSSYPPDDLKEYWKQLKINEDLIFGKPNDRHGYTKYRKIEQPVPLLIHEGITHYTMLSRRQFSQCDELLLETYNPLIDLYKYQRNYSWKGKHYAPTKSTTRNGDIPKC